MQLRQNRCSQLVIYLRRVVKYLRRGVLFGGELERGVVGERNICRLSVLKRREANDRKHLRGGDRVREDGEADRTEEALHHRRVAEEPRGLQRQNMVIHYGRAPTEKVAGFLYWGSTSPLRMWHKGRNRSKAGAASIELLIVGSFVSIVEDIIWPSVGCKIKILPRTAVLL